MVELNHLEVQIFRRADSDEDLGAFEAGGGQTCTFTQTRIIPFPEYNILSAYSTTVPSKPAVTSYVEVTPGASYRVDLQVLEGFEFENCDAISFNIRIDNDKPRYVFVWKANYMNADDPVGAGRWASYLPGEFNCKFLLAPLTANTLKDSSQDQQVEKCPERARQHY